MFIEMPKNINVTLTMEEQDIIEKCYDLLTKIQQEMEIHNCSVLEDCNGGICSVGQMYDIKHDLATILHAEVMYGD